MLKSKHYVPILKWKSAEHSALKALTEKDKDSITPLIELVLPTVPQHKDKAKKIKKTDDEMLVEMVLKFKETKIKKNS